MGSIASTVILAAGLGTRMKSALPKVLHPVCGVPLLSHVLAASEAVGSERTVVVLGHGHELVEPLLPEGTQVVLQHEQRGTGHALLCAREFVGEGPLLVLTGDTPLITGEALQALVEAHAASRAGATVLTMELLDPAGYGRILRDGEGWVTRIVEHRDASPEERLVGEVNTGMYVLPGRRSLEILDRVGTDNAQGELYLTDVVAGLRAEGVRVGAVVTPDPSVALGVNSRVELAQAQTLMTTRLLERWMLAGVTVEDPGSTHIDATVTLEADVRILPFTCLRGRTTVAAGSEIGPGSTLVDTVVGARSQVRHSYTDGAVIEAGAKVGPFSYLRPQAHLLEDSKAGAFVEIKKSTVGRGSKVPHLSYIGDTVIGEGTNIGAGNITANYDGRRKHATVIGDDVRTGSDTVFVAPVTVGHRATVAAGSVITKDVPDGALGVARARQRNIVGYRDREDAGEAGSHGD